jgi:hypothetical protein
METPAYRSANRRPDRFNFRKLICLFAALLGSSSPGHADIPWPEVNRRVARENDLLARRPHGHTGEYFVVCTLYFTPMESGFRADRGFDVTPMTRPGLSGRMYPRDFLAAVKKEGVGRLRHTVNGCNYIRYDRGRTYRFVKQVVGRGTDQLIPRFSAAARRGQKGFGYGNLVETADPGIKQVFGSSSWKIADTGGGLRRWQIDLYWGEDEPLGPGRLMARPRSTHFEYACSVVKVR